MYQLQLFLAIHVYRQWRELVNTVFFYLHQTQPLWPSVCCVNCVGLVNTNASAAFVVCLCIQHDEEFH